MQATLSQLLQSSIAANPVAMAIEYEGRQYSWGFIATIVSQLNSLLEQLQIGRFERVGFIAQTKPEDIAAMWGLLAFEKCASMIYGFQPSQKLAADIISLASPVVVAHADHWNDATIEAARQAGSAGIVLDENGLRLVDGLETVGRNADRTSLPQAAMETLSSGTTGIPKRILLSLKNLRASAEAAAASIRQMNEGVAQPKPLIVMFPLANISGVYSTVPAGITRHPIALMEKFSVDEWLSLVRKYRPTAVDVPPTALAMLVKAGVTREDLQGIKVIRSGAAPLDAEVHRVIDEEFGIPINLSYGASEFCGVVTTWSMDDLAIFRKSKRGSCGRPLPGVKLRIVDGESGKVLDANSPGLLEAQVERVGESWIRTNDIMRLDEDGFLWFVGRADSTILRGGFKIAPEALAELIRRHPKVADAAVVGKTEQRLGEVPVAFIQPARDSAAPTESELTAYCRQHMAAYEVPVRFVCLSELPRTPSMKLNLAKLKELS